MLVYGRYVEVVAPPLVALALVALTRARASPIVAVVLAASVAVAALRAAVHAPEAPSFWNVMSLPLRTDALGAASLLGAGLLACGAASALFWVARRRPEALAPLLLLLMFVPTTVFAERQLLQRSAAVYPSGWASLPRVGSDRIDYDQRNATFDGQFIYPWFATGSTIVTTTRRVPTGRYLISSDVWNRAHPTLAATAVWRDPARDQTLWRIDRPRGTARLVCAAARGSCPGPAAAPPGRRRAGCAHLAPGTCSRRASTPRPRGRG